MTTLLGKSFISEIILLQISLLPKNHVPNHLFLTCIPCTVPHHHKSNGVNVCLTEDTKINPFKKFEYQIKHS